MLLQANLRLDSSYTPGMKSARVQEVIKQMGLTDCENVRIGFPGMSTTISGGERKRLSFASEVTLKILFKTCSLWIKFTICAYNLANVLVKFRG